jgi:hypothetical protein
MPRLLLRSERASRVYWKLRFSTDAATRERQLDENPGLWIRLNPNVTSFVLPDLL